MNLWMKMQEVLDKNTKTLYYIKHIKFLCFTMKKQIYKFLGVSKINISTAKLQKSKSLKMNAKKSNGKHRVVG